MRVAILGATGARRTEASIVRALRSLGHRCVWIDVRRWVRRVGRLAPALIRRAVDAFEPSVVICTKHAAVLDEPALRAVFRERDSVLWFFDLAPEPPPELVTLARHVNRFYVTVASEVERFHAAGAPRPLFMPQAVDPHYDRPATGAPRRYRCEVSFIGSGQYPVRHQLLRAVDARYNLHIRGPGWDYGDQLPIHGRAVWGRRYARVVHAADISLGAHAVPEHVRAVSGASNRMWKVMGCGGFYLGPYVEGIESFAAHGHQCAWYRDTNHVLELIEHYLSQSDERERIAVAGRAHALAHHTYRHRVEQILAGESYDGVDEGRVSVGVHARKSAYTST